MFYMILKKINNAIVDLLIIVYIESNNYLNLMTTGLCILILLNKLG